MCCLTVEDLPEKTMYALKSRAEANNRSLNGEILFIFDWVASHGLAEMPLDITPGDPVVSRQKREMEKLIGSWDDDRSAAEIIEDIRSARTAGREVTL